MKLGRFETGYRSFDAKIAKFCIFDSALEIIFPDEQDQLIVARKWMAEAFGLVADDVVSEQIGSKVIYFLILYS